MSFGKADKPKPISVAPSPAQPETTKARDELRMRMQRASSRAKSISTPGLLEIEEPIISKPILRTTLG